MHRPRGRRFVPARPEDDGARHLAVAIRDLARLVGRLVDGGQPRVGEERDLERLARDRRRRDARAHVLDDELLRVQAIQQNDQQQTCERANFITHSTLRFVSGEET